MTVKNGAKLYPASKKSSNGIKALEDLEREMKQEKQKIDRIQQSIEDYDTGWSDDFEDTPVKRAALEKELKASEQSYAEKYKNYSDFMKGLHGMEYSAVAAFPAVAQVIGTMVDEAESKLSSDEWRGAREEERKTKAALDKYTSENFGFYDLIDPNEVEGLTERLTQATENRKRTDALYDKTVDVNSGAMKKMGEALWLKNSATEDLNGVWKTLADTAIDVGQGITLLPLKLGGPKMYIAGLATNAAAEEMYTQAAKGKKVNDVFLSGLVTAGTEAAKGALAEAKIPAKDLLEKIGMVGESRLANRLESMGIPAAKEAINYVIDFLADKAWRDPEAKFNMLELFLNATAGGASGLIGQKSNDLTTGFKAAWAQLGG